LFFDKGTKSIQSRKTAFLTNGTKATGYTWGEKKRNTKINSKWIMVLNVKENSKTFTKSFLKS